jgi:DUF4097 and DUF4098 domain-containing protein YvlB
VSVPRRAGNGKETESMKPWRESLIIVASAVVLAVLLAPAVSAEQPYRESFDQTYPLAAGGRVGVENINGDVTIEVWERAEVRVQAEKSASSQTLLDDLEVEVHARPDSVRIDTHYPRTMRGGSTEVEYTITVPRQAAVDAVDLINGDLTVVGVEGGVEAESVNGTILAREIHGSVELSTVNGTVEAHLGVVDRDARVNLESVNGRVEVHLAPSASAEVEAETVNGRIRNDFGIEVKKGKFVGSSMRGTLGAGDASIELSTVNGGISILSE